MGGPSITFSMFPTYLTPVAGSLSHSPEMSAACSGMVAKT